MTQPRRNPGHTPPPPDFIAQLLGFFQGNPGVISPGQLSLQDYAVMAERRGNMNEALASANINPYDQAALYHFLSDIGFDPATTQNIVSMAGQAHGMFHNFLPEDVLHALSGPGGSAYLAIENLMEYNLAQQRNRWGQNKAEDDIYVSNFAQAYQNSIQAAMAYGGVNFKEATELQRLMNKTGELEQASFRETINKLASGDSPFDTALMFSAMNETGARHQDRDRRDQVLAEIERRRFEFGLDINTDEALSGLAELEQFYRDANAGITDLRREQQRLSERTDLNAEDRSQRIGAIEQQIIARQQSANESARQVIAANRHLETYLEIEGTGAQLDAILTANKIQQVANIHESVRSTFTKLGVDTSSWGEEGTDAIMADFGGDRGVASAAARDRTAKNINSFFALMTEEATGFDSASIINWQSTIKGLSQAQGLGRYSGNYSRVIAQQMAQLTHGGSSWLSQGALGQTTRDDVLGVTASRAMQAAGSDMQNVTGMMINMGLLSAEQIASGDVSDNKVMRDLMSGRQMTSEQVVRETQAMLRAQGRDISAGTLRTQLGQRVSNNLAVSLTNAEHIVSRMSEEQRLEAAFDPRTWREQGLTTDEIRARREARKHKPHAERLLDLSREDERIFLDWQEMERQINEATENSLGDITNKMLDGRMDPRMLHAMGMGEAQLANLQRVKDDIGMRGLTGTAAVTALQGALDPIREAKTNMNHIAQITGFHNFNEMLGHQRAMVTDRIKPITFDPTETDRLINANIQGVRVVRDANGNIRYESNQLEDRERAYLNAGVSANISRQLAESHASLKSPDGTLNEELIHNVAVYEARRNKAIKSYTDQGLDETLATWLAENRTKIEKADGTFDEEGMKQTVREGLEMTAVAQSYRDAGLDKHEALALARDISKLANQADDGSWEFSGLKALDIIRQQQPNLSAAEETLAINELRRKFTTAEARRGSVTDAQVNAQLDQVRAGHTEIREQSEREKAAVKQAYLDAGIDEEMAERLAETSMLTDRQGNFNEARAEQEVRREMNKEVTRAAYADLGLTEEGLEQLTNRPGSITSRSGAFDDKRAAAFIREEAARKGETLTDQQVAARVGQLRTNFDKAKEARRNIKDEAVADRVGTLREAHGKAEEARELEIGHAAIEAEKQKIMQGYHESELIEKGAFKKGFGHENMEFEASMQARRNEFIVDGKIDESKRQQVAEEILREQKITESTKTRLERRAGEYTAADGTIDREARNRIEAEEKAAATAAHDANAASHSRETQEKLKQRDAHGRQHAEAEAKKGRTWREWWRSTKDTRTVDERLAAQDIEERRRTAGGGGAGGAGHVDAMDIGSVNTINLTGDVTFNAPQAQVNPQ